MHDCWMTYSEENSGMGMWWEQTISAPQSINQSINLFVQIKGQKGPWGTDNCPKYIKNILNTATSIFLKVVVVLSIPTSPYFCFYTTLGNKNGKFDAFSRHLTTHFVNHTSVNTPAGKPGHNATPVPNGRIGPETTKYQSLASAWKKATSTSGHSCTQGLTTPVVFSRRVLWLAWEHQL